VLVEGGGGSGTPPGRPTIQGALAEGDPAPHRPAPPQLDPGSTKQEAARPPRRPPRRARLLAGEPRTTAKVRQAGRPSSEDRADRHGPRFLVIPGPVVARRAEQHQDPGASKQPAPTHWARFGHEISAPNDGPTPAAPSGTTAPVRRFGGDGRQIASGSAEMGYLDLGRTPGRYLRVDP